MWRQDLDARGFAIIPSVISPKEISHFLGKLDWYPLRRSRAGVRHALSVPPVASLAQDPKLLRIAEIVFDAGAMPFRATLFEKSVRANWLVAWHQDTALPLRERHEVPDWGPWSVKDGVNYAHAPGTVLSHVVALRVHLDDSAKENGSLRVLPGTHSHGVLTDEQIRGLAAEVPPEECLVPCGGILVMRPLLVHSSSKARNKNPRRVLHIEYATSLAIADGLELAIA